jgi:hypothetical protein
MRRTRFIMAGLVAVLAVQATAAAALLLDGGLPVQVAMQHLR